MDELRQEFHELLDKAMVDPNGHDFAPEVLSAIGMYVRAEVCPVSAHSIRVAERFSSQQDTSMG